MYTNPQVWSWSHIVNVSGDKVSQGNLIEKWIWDVYERFDVDETQICKIFVIRISSSFTIYSCDDSIW